MVIIRDEINKVVDRLQFNNICNKISLIDGVMTVGYSGKQMPYYNLFKDVTIAGVKYQVIEMGFNYFKLANVPSDFATNIFTVIGTAPYFFAGHPLQIISELQLIASTSNSEHRYPFIALIMNFEERSTNEILTAELNFVVGTLSDAKWLNNVRKEKTFIPILYPLVKSFINGLNGGTNLLLSHDYNYTKEDFYFYGKKGLYGVDGNIFQDHLDVVEIKTELNFIDKCIN